MAAITTETTTTTTINAADTACTMAESVMLMTRCYQPFPGAQPTSEIPVQRDVLARILRTIVRNGRGTLLVLVRSLVWRRSWR